MSGVCKGVQAILKKEQPLTLFGICGAHCNNLITKDSAECSVCTQNVLQWANELGILNNSTNKFSGILKSSVAHVEEELYPTRILDTLEEMKAYSSKAGALFYNFSIGETVHGLLMITDIINLLEKLNESAQGRQRTVSGLLEAVSIVQATINVMKTDEDFMEILQSQ
ncbi:hypothetical protein PR048_011374 [Dryococelus australis]|uniref:Uncharacterized protein n=1 Tax=Dryococelus australis TaxID=614101 RepID=A0ABQ9HLD7_9NEOP|nr:hypothetical protein PR048_011374 [Dryococelus australis]